MRPSIGSSLFSGSRIETKVRELAKKIANDYKDEPLTIIAVLSGAVRFTADLLKHFGNDLRVKVTFVEVQSYKSDKPGNLRLGSLSEELIRGQNILIVDDILDTGKTLFHLKGVVQVFEPKSLKTVVLLSKTKDRQYEVTPDYLGFPVPDVFVVGYGLDSEGLFRNLSCITTLIDDRHAPHK